MKVLGDHPFCLLGRADEEVTGLRGKLVPIVDIEQSHSGELIKIVIHDVLDDFVESQPT